MRFVDDEQRLTAVLVVRRTLAAAAAGREQTASERAVAGRRRLGRRAGRARRRPRASPLAARNVEVEPGRVGGAGVAAADPVVVRLQVVGAEATAQETDAGREVFPPARQRHHASPTVRLLRVPTTHRHYTVSEKNIHSYYCL